jgi:hypothetical protein
VIAGENVTVPKLAVVPLAVTGPAIVTHAEPL